jgi:predicted alpha/beta hydrolase family esterase
MTVSTTTAVKAEESIADHNRADNASDAFLVGVDQNGRGHYYSRIRNRVTVLRDGEHVHTEALTDGTIADWMAFIDEELCRWDETNVYSGSTSDQLCNQFAVDSNGGSHDTHLAVLTVLPPDTSGDDERDIHVGGTDRFTLLEALISPG